MEVVDGFGVFGFDGDDDALLAHGGGEAFVREGAVGEFEEVPGTQEDDAICGSEGFGEIAFLEAIAAAGVAGLDDDDESAIGVTRFECLEIFGDGEGVVGLVEDEGETVVFDDGLHATEDTFKLGKGGGGFFDADASGEGGAGGEGGVEGEGAAGLGEGEGVAAEVEARAVGVEGEVGDAVVGFGCPADGLDFGGSDFLEVEGVWAMGVEDEATGGGEGFGKGVEFGFDVLEGGVDFGVIEVDVGNDEGVGLVVVELGGAVVFGGGVFIAFEDGDGAVLHADRKGEVRALAAEEEVGFFAGVLKDPGEHGGGGGFAFGAGDDEAFGVREQVAADELGHVADGDAAFEGGLDFDVIGRDGGAHDEEAGVFGDVAGGEFFGEAEAGVLEELIHGSVLHFVGGGEAVT